MSVSPHDQHARQVPLPAPRCHCPLALSSQLHQYDFRTPNRHGCQMSTIIKRDANGFPMDRVGKSQPTLGSASEDSDDEHAENDEL